MNLRYLAYGMVCSVALSGGDAFAQRPPRSPDGEWHVELVPYLWAAGIKGDVGIGERISDISVVGRTPSAGVTDRIKVLWIKAGNRVYTVATNDVELKGPSEGKKAARKIGGRAGVGALAGGILGGGKGAAIGAVAGATTGAVITGSGKEHLRIPAETRLQFRLHTSVRVQRT